VVAFGGFYLSVIPSEPADDVSPATRDPLMSEDVKSKSRFLASLGMTDEVFKMRLLHGGIVLSESEIETIVRQARTIAVVGMQDEAHSDRAAYQIPEMLKHRGYRLLPVNPAIESSLGEKAYPNVAALPMVPDILDVFRRPEVIPDLTDEILNLPPEKRPPVVWLQSGIAHPESEKRLEEVGVKVVSDRCLGVYAARVRR